MCVTQFNRFFHLSVAQNAQPRQWFIRILLKYFNMLLNLCSQNSFPRLLAFGCEILKISRASLILIPTFASSEVSSSSEASSGSWFSRCRRAMATNGSGTKAWNQKQLTGHIQITEINKGKQIWQPKEIFWRIHPWSFSQLKIRHFQKGDEPNLEVPSFSASMLG